jgi:3-hydroxyisobutyrate dehydrogenase-like beta-hydroxyacid dehydrogenase
MSAQRRIGVIGAGNIGGAIAANLIADGHAVTVHDADPARVRTLVDAGAAAVASPAAVGERSEITFTSLPTPAIMAAVADAWLGGAPADAVLVDLSTNAPATVREVGARLAAAGRHLLEAPLTGGAPGAQARMLVFMLGGERAVVERCRPVLEKLGRAVFHLGDLGLGNTAKLVNSLLAFTATWASLEGLAVAAKAGINLRTMIDVVRTGGAGNFFTDRMVEGINQRGRPTQFALALAAKDAGLLVDVAREAGVPVPVAAEVAQALVAAVGAGLGDRDFTDIVELIERQAGVRLSLPPPPETAR